jgi:hypothetical protein
MTLERTFAGKSRTTMHVNEVPGSEKAEFSTLVRTAATGPLIVERTMSWDATHYGAHTEHASEDPSRTWYFAEGSQGFFHIRAARQSGQGPESRDVQYLREGEAPVVGAYALTPESRLTVDAGADAALVGRSFGIVVTFAQPGMAERAMYFGDAPLFNGGHESAGSTALSTNWFLAEGATGPFFETFVLLANPNAAAADVTMTFLPLTGAPVVVTKALPGHSRLTVNIEQESRS